MDAALRCDESHMWCECQVSLPVSLEARGPDTLNCTNERIMTAWRREIEVGTSKAFSAILRCWIARVRVVQDDHAVSKMQHGVLPLPNQKRLRWALFRGFAGGLGLRRIANCVINHRIAATWSCDRDANAFEG